MKAILFVCVVILLMGTISLKAQEKNLDQDKSTIDSTSTDKESPVIAWGTTKEQSGVVAIGYGPAPRKDISVAIPNAYVADDDDSIAIPNVYQGDDNVAIPNAFKGIDTLSSKLIKKQSRPIDTLNGLKWQHQK